MSTPKRPGDSVTGTRPSQKRLKKTDVDEDNKQYLLRQRYRALEQDMIRYKAAAMRGDSDISTAMKQLSSANVLFDADVSKDNGLLALDAKAIVTVTQLAQLNVQNLKFKGVKSKVNVEDIRLFMKKYMLKEYFKQNGITEKVEGHLEETTTEDVDNLENSSTSDAATIGQNMKKQAQKKKYLEQFDEYSKFNQFNWFKMGSLFQKHGHAVEVTDHLLGPFSVQKKVRAVRKRRVADETQVTKKVVTADKVTKEDLNKKQDVTTPDLVHRCFKILEKEVGFGGTIPLFQFILDPNSFAQSIENLFYTSFLIKEGRLILDENPEDGFPRLKVVKDLRKMDTQERELEKQRRSDAKQNHIIFQMDMSTWKSLLKRFDIKEGYIATRLGEQ